MCMYVCIYVCTYVCTPLIIFTVAYSFHAFHMLVIIIFGNRYYQLCKSLSPVIHHLEVKFIIQHDINSSELNNNNKRYLYIFKYIPRKLSIRPSQIIKNTYACSNIYGKTSVFRTSGFIEQR